MAGVSYDVSRNIKLDMGYKYSKIGSGNQAAFDSANIVAGGPVAPCQASARPSSRQAIDLTREVLGVPGGLPHRHRAGLRHRRRRDGDVVDAGRPRPCTMLAWESFGEGWVTDVVKQLKLDDVSRPPSTARSSDLSTTVDFDTRRGLHLERHHLGVRVPNADFDPGRPRRA
jgi:hypothetical protein